MYRLLCINYCTKHTVRHTVKVVKRNFHCFLLFFRYLPAGGLEGCSPQPQDGFIKVRPLVGLDLRFSFDFRGIPPGYFGKSAEAVEMIGVSENPFGTLCKEWGSC